MVKIINYLKEHKTQAITILTGCISLLVAINTNISTSTKVGLFITFATIALSLLLSVIQSGFSDEAINLIVKAIEIIQEIIAENKTTEATNDNITAVKNVKIVKLTEEEIRERLVAKD